MNTPRIDPDDPKWTAYVLGEVSEEERAEIDRLLESSVEARALVEELSVATSALRDELLPPAPVLMLPDQREAVKSAAGHGSPEPRRWFEIFPAQWAWGLGAAAVAGVVVMVGLLPFVVERESTSVLQTAKLEERAEPVISAADRDLDDARKADAASAPVEEWAQRSRETLPQEYKERAKLESPGTVAPSGSREEVKRSEASAGLALPSENAALVEYLSDLQKKQAAGQIQIIVDGFSDGKLPSRDQISEIRTANNSFTAESGRFNNSQIQQGQQGGLQGFELERDFRQREAAEATVQQGRGGGGGGGRGVGAATGARPPVGVLGGVVAATPPPPPPPPPAPPPPAPPPVALAAARAPAAAAVPPAAIDRADQPRPSIGTEAYDRIIDNPFIRAIQEPLATFSIDVDTASYANVRRFLNQNQAPPKDAVRIEELVNYFSYDYAQPTGQAPIAPNMEVASAPWNPANRLVRIGIKAREINNNRRPPSNLVFLVDVSGSMAGAERLPLARTALKMLVNNLGENDFVSMVVYAGSSGLVLPPTSGMRKDTILQAIDNLQAGGSTNGGAGIQLAYNQAVSNFIKGGVNRVILVTDGDFNVGITNQGDLTRLIEDRAKSGVFLSVLGFGMGNLKDSTMEKLADMGNGHYAYIDTINEARKVLVEEMGGTLVTVAKDVKIQVDFNPGRVEAYRLIGYENRVLRAEDFNNDLKDAGDMGAGHTVTALFEVVPRGGSVPGSVDPSRYQVPPAAARERADASTSNEMLTLRVRYKLPDAAESTRMDVPLTDRNATFARASQDFRFAASVASFGMILRESPYKGTSTMNSVLDMATGSRGQDRNGYRAEFLSLVRRAAAMGRW